MTATRSQQKKYAHDISLIPENHSPCEWTKINIFQDLCEKRFLFSLEKFSLHQTSDFVSHSTCVLVYTYTDIDSTLSVFIAIIRQNTTYPKKSYINKKWLHDFVLLSLLGIPGKALNHLSCRLMLCFVFIKSTPMKMGITQALNLPKETPTPYMSALPVYPGSPPPDWLENSCPNRDRLFILQSATDEFIVTLCQVALKCSSWLYTTPPQDQKLKRQKTVLEFVANKISVRRKKQIIN